MVELIQRESKPHRWTIGAIVKQRIDDWFIEIDDDGNHQENCSAFLFFITKHNRLHMIGYTCLYFLLTHTVIYSRSWQWCADAPPLSGRRKVSSWKWADADLEWSDCSEWLVFNYMPLKNLFNETVLGRYVRSRCCSISSSGGTPRGDLAVGASSQRSHYLSSEIFTNETFRGVKDFGVYVFPAHFFDRSDLNLCNQSGGWCVDAQTGPSPSHLWQLS